MLTTTFIRAIRAPVAARAFSTSLRALAAGDTGSVRPGGERAGDAMQRRERASEELFIRNQEREKLLDLKKKLKAQREHINELEKTIDDMTYEEEKK